MRARLHQATEDYALAAKYFRGLGDPTRLAVLQILAQRGELTVSQLGAAVGVAQGRLSDHLACLRWCHYVETRRQGKHVYYSIVDGRLLQVLRLVNELSQEQQPQLDCCQRIRDF